jgi:hypothetical protein
MTIVAWDGKTLAADKLGDSSGFRRTTTKIRRFDGGLFGSAGMGSYAAHMFEWIKSGARPETIPAFQLTDEYQNVLVVRNDGTVWIYAQSPYPFEMEDAFHAIGSGRDFAIATMYLGFGAVHAVHVASQFETGCGNGIDTLEL